MRPIFSFLLAMLSLAFVGRWISKETRGDEGISSSDRTEIIVRSLTLDANGSGALRITLNGRVTQNAAGRWSVLNDVLFLDHENGQAINFRIVRITTERLVIRNPDGGERIYDRLL